MKEESPIALFLTAVDSFDLDAAMSAFTSDSQLLMSDGRKVEGSKSVKTMLEGFLRQLRSVTHEIQAEWHVDDVWIAETTASYELRDWQRFEGLRRAVICRVDSRGIVDLRFYGVARAATHGPRHRRRTDSDGGPVGVSSVEEAVRRSETRCCRA